MATEAETPESVPLTKIAGGNIYLEKEQSEYSVEKGKMQVATRPEAMNTTIEANVETVEGERFFESSSGAEVSCKDSYNESKQMVDDVKTEVADESGKEGSEIMEESGEKPEKHDENPAIESFTGNSLRTAEIEEASFTRKGVSEEWSIDSHSEVITDQDVPVEDKSLEKETGEVYHNQEVECNKEVIGMPETKLDHNGEASIRVPDLTVVSFNKDGTGEAFTQSLAVRPDIQSDEEATSKIKEGDEEIVDKPYATSATEASSIHEAELKENTEVIEKITKDDCISTEKEEIHENPEQKGDYGTLMKHEGELSEHDDVAATDTSPGEDICNEGSTSIVNKDDTSDTEIINALERSQSGMPSHEERPENLQQNKPEEEKLERSLSVVDEDFIAASSTECVETIKEEACIKIPEGRYEEKIIDALEHGQSKTSDREEQPEDSSIVVSTESAEIRTRVQGETPFKSQEKNFEKILREDLPIHTDTDSKNEIPEDKDVPELELNEKTEGAEVEVPNENANDIHDPHPLIEVAKQTEEINLDKVSSFKCEGRAQEVNEASAEEQYIKDPPEPYQSQNLTIIEHPSTEGEVKTELTPQTNETDIKELHVPELESEEKSVIKGSIATEKSEEENNTEQVIELESVEQVSVKSLEDEEKKAEEVTGEISENFKTESAAEGIEYEASKTIESPQEIPDTCQVKEEESLQKEEKNLTATESSLEEKLEKNEAEEKLEQPLHLITEKNETFRSEANETPCQIEEGATETLKEALQKEETEEKIDIEANKTAIEEDLQMLVETSNTSESIETTALEPKTEISNVVAEDDIKMEDTKELLESCKDAGKNDEAEKWSIVALTESAETRTSVQEETPFKSQEESFEKIVKGDLPIHTETDSKNEIPEDKEVPEIELNKKIEGAEVEVSNNNENDIRDPHPSIEVAKQTEEINLDKVSSFEPEGRTQEVNDASTEEKYMEGPPEPYQGRNMTIVEHPSTEGEVKTELTPQTNETEVTELESEEKSVIKGNTAAEKSEEENNTEQVIELESVEQVSVKSLEDVEKKAEEVTGEISENSKTDRAAEGIEHEASKTIESPQEIPDTCQVREEESLQKEEKNLTATESSLEEKLEKNEAEEKLEQPLHLITEKNETFRSEANETPCQMEEGATETLKEALQKEETEEKNDIEANKTAIEEDLQMLVETSNASESIETTALEPKTEISNVVAEDDIKMEDTKELLESCKDAGKNDEAEKWSIVALTESAETRTSVQEETPFKSQEESFEKIVKGDLSIHTETDSKNEIPEDKDVPEIELNKKIEGAEVEVSNKNENDIRDPHPSIEVAKQTEEINLDKVSSFEPEGRTQEVNDASTEEKYMEDPPEPYQGRNMTIVEHPSTEGEVKTELTPQTNETEVTELESEEKSVIKGNTAAEKSEEENNTEQVIELESVEQVSVKSLEDVEKKAEEVTGEISENFKTDGAAEGIEHEASKTIENPQEIPDTCQVREEESLQKEEKNLTATESSLEEKLEKNEAEEKLEQPLHLITEKNETFRSEANETPCQMEEEATETLKEALQKEETEEKNDIEANKTAIEEDLQMLVETSNASESIETTALEPKTEISNVVAEDDIKMEDAKELLESCKDTGKNDEAEKWSIVALTESAETRTSVQGETPFKSQEESFEKIVKGDLPIHTETDSKNEIPEDKDVPEIELNKKIEGAEVEVPNNNVNDIRDPHPSIEIAKQTEEINLDKVSSFEPEGRTQEVNDASTEEKYMEDPSESYQCQNMTIVEHPSTEGEVKTELTPQTNETEVTELESEKKSVIKGNTAAEKSEEENNTEQVIELESVEQVSVKSLEDVEKKAEEVTGEISENFKTDRAAESIEHEASKTIESPQEILDTCQVKEEESLQKEETNLTATESSLEEKLEKNEAEEKLEQPLHLITKKNETFSSEANETPCQMEEGATETLKKALQREETEKETEENNDIEGSKIEIEEDLQMLVETSNASESIETTVLKPKTEISNMVAEDDIKMEDTKELLESCKDTGKDEEADKHERKEECVIIPEAFEEKTVQCSEEDKKEEEESRGLEVEKIEQSSEEGHPVTNISSELIEQETAVIHPGETNEVKKPEGENNLNQFVEETNVRDLIPESVDQVPVKNLENEEKEAKDFTGKNFEPETEKTTEIIVNETCKTTESLGEIPDTFQVKQGESLQSEEKNETVTESSPEEKSLETELTEKLEKPLSSDSNENEAFVSNSNEVHNIKGEGSPQNREEALETEENEKETEFKSYTKDYNIALEKDDQVDVEISDTSKSIESTILESKAEMENLVVEDDTKKEESKEIYEEIKYAGEVEETQKHDITEECDTIPAPIGENIVQSSEDDKKEEETPKVEASAQLEVISVGEDDQKRTQNEENILDQSRELEAEKTEQSSKEDHIVPSILSKSIQHETAETYPGNANEAENPGEEDKQIVEESDIRDCIPESVEKISVKDLKDEENKAEEHTREGFEKSKTEETTEDETRETIESPREILDTFQVKQEESSATKELNVAATESSKVEESKKNKPEEKTEIPLSSMSDKTEAFNSDAEKLPCQIEEGAPQNLEEAPHEEEHEKETEDNKITVEKDNQAVVEASDTSKSTKRTILESKTKMDKMVDEDGTGKEQSEELCEDKDVKVAEEQESVVEQSREMEVEKTELHSIEEHAIANMSLESIDHEVAVISSGNEIKAEESEGKSNVSTEESNIGSLIPKPVEQVSLKKVEDEEKKEHESTGEILDSPKTKEVVGSAELEISKTLESPREILDTLQEKHGESLRSEEKDLTAVESSQNLEQTPQKEEKENVAEEKNNIEENRIAVKESLQEVAGTSDDNTTTESAVLELKTEKDNVVVEDGVKKEESKEFYENFEDAEVEKHEMVEECVNTDILQEITGENSLKSPGADKKEEETSKIELEETGVAQEGVDRSKSSECTNISKEPSGEKVHQSSGNDKKDEETSKTEGNSAGEDAEEQSVKEEIMVDQSREEVKKVEQKNKPEEKTEKPYSSMSNKNEAFNSDAEKLPCQMEEGAPQNVEEASHEEENEKEIDDIKIAMEEDNSTVVETTDTSKITETTILEPNTKMDSLVDEDDTGKKQSQELCKDKDVEVTEEKENIVEQPREVEVEKTKLSSVEEHAIANMSLESIDQEAVVSRNEMKAEESEGKNDAIIEDSNIGSLIPELVEQVSLKNMEDEEKKDNESTGEILDRPKTEEVVDSAGLETSKTMERPREILDTFQEKHGESLQSEERELTAVESSQNLEEAPQKEENENVTEGKNDIEENRKTVEESLQEVAGTSDANKTTESDVLELKTEKDKIIVEDDVKEEESKEIYRNSKTTETEKHDMVKECVNMDTLQETNGEKSLQSTGVDKKEEETSKIELEETGVVQDAETQTLKGAIVDQSTEFEAHKSEESFKEDYTFGYISPESIEQEIVEISSVSVNKIEQSEGKNNVVQVVEESNITNLNPELVEQAPVKNLEEEEKKAEMSTREIFDNIKVEEATQRIENETSKNRSMEIHRESLDTFQVKQGESLPSEEKNLTIAKESPPGSKIEESLSDGVKISCLMEDRVSQIEGALMKAEKENDKKDNNQSEDKKIPKEEDLEVVGETSDASKNAESIVLEPKSEIDNRIAEDDIKNEESQEVCENFADPAEVEEIEQRGVSSKEIVQTSEEDKKEEEIPQIEVSSYSEPTRVEEQLREFEVEKTGQSFKKEHTIANISPQSIEQETIEIHEESENQVEELEGKDRIEQVVEESNIYTTETSIEKNPQESEPEEKHEHLLPLTKSDKTEAFSSKNATMPCQMEEKVAQNLEEAPQKEEHMKEIDDNKDNKIEVQEEVQEDAREKIHQSSGDDKKEEETSKTEGNNVGEDAEEQSVKEEIMVEQSRKGVEKVEQHFEEDNMESKMPIEETTGENSLQSLGADKKEKETSKIELEETGVAHDAETLTLKEGDIADQSTEFEAHKSEKSFKEDYTLDYISPELIEPKTVEISPVSVNEKEKSEGKNNVVQMVEESNITDLIPESVELVPIKNLEDGEKKAEMSTGEISDNIKVEEATQSIENETGKSRTMEIPRESLDTFQIKQEESLPTEEKNLTIAKESPLEPNIEESLSDGGKIPCLIEDGVSQIEGAPMKTEKKNETEDNNESEDKEIPKEKDLQVVAEISAASKSAESTVEDDIKNEESQEVFENFVDAAKVEEIEQHDVPDECVSTKEIVQSSEEVKKEEEIPEIEASSCSEPTRVEEQSRELEVEKTEQSFKGEHTVANISPPSIEQEATEINEKCENKAEESEGKNIVEQEVEESNVDTTESLIEKNPQESEPEEKFEHFLPSEIAKMPCQMEEKAAENLEEAPQKEEHMKETDDNKDNKVEVQQEVQEGADRSKSSSLEPTGEKIYQSSGDDKKDEETSKTEANSVGEDAEVHSGKEDDIESKIPIEERKRTQKVDEDVDAKKQNIEDDAAENNIKASEIADFTTSREIPSIVDTKEGLISSTNEDDTVVERSPEDGRKAMKVDELFVEEIEETSSAMEKVSETLKDSEKSNVDSSPREIGECLDEKSSLVPEALEENTEKEEKIIDDSDFASAMVAKEEICLTETELEGEKQVECQATEKIENIKENEVPDIRSEDKKDATSDERPLEETPEEVESSTMTSKEHEIVTVEARETTSLSNVSEVGLVDTAKEPTNEEVQKERFEDLYVHSELDKENPLSVSEGVEISKKEETRELADHIDDCASKTLEDVESSISSSKLEKTEDNPFDEALKTTGTYNICADTGKDVLEQEMIEVEKEAIEKKGEAESQRVEDKDTKYTAEEIVKSADRDQILQHPSEAGSGDGKNEMLPETDKNQIEENFSNIKKQEDENEKEKPKLETDDSEEQKANETIKVVILAEETLEGVEQSNDSEVIKDPVLQEEHGISEPHVLSTVGEKAYEVLEYSEYTGTVDSRKKTETESSELEESSITEREASFAGQSKEQKLEDSGIEPPAELEGKIEEITESSKNQNATSKTETEAIPGEAQLHGSLVEGQGELCSKNTEEISTREREASFAGQSKEQKVQDSSIEPPTELEEKIEEITESSTLTTETESVLGEAQLHGRLVEDQGEPCSEKTEESSIREREASFAGQSKEQVEDSSIEPPAELEEKIEEITENSTLTTETEEIPGEAQLHDRLVEDQREPCSEKTEESSIREREASFAGQSKQQKVEDSSFEPPVELEEKIEEITESSKSHNVTLTTETQAIPREAQLHGRLVEDQGEPCSGKTEIEYAQQGKEVNNMKIEETSIDLKPELQTVEYMVTGEPDETKRVSEPVHESKEGSKETELEKCPTVKKMDQFTANDFIHAEKKNVAASSVVYETQDEVAEGTAKTGESQTMVTTDQVPSTNSEDAEADSPPVETPNTDENEAKVVQEAICESKYQGIEESGESAGVEKLDQVPATKSEDVMKRSVPEENSEADEVVETEIASKMVPLSKEQGTGESNETGKSPTAEKLAKDKSEEASEETSDHGVIGEPGIEPVEKLDQVPATYSGDVMKGSVPEENSEADGVVETDIASNMVPQSKEQDTNETDETGKSPTAEKPYTDKSKEACKETSDHRVIGERGIEPIEKLDQLPATNSEDVMKGSVPEENSEADEVVETAIASKIVPLSKEQGTDESDETEKSPTAEKPYRDKSEACEEASDHGITGEPDIEPVEKLDQVPATNSGDVMKGSVPEENSEADGVVETDISSNIVPQSKEQGTNESDETGKSPTAEKPDTDKSEEACKETSDREVIGEPGIDPVAKGEITAEQTPPAEKLTEWILTLTSELPSEHGDTTTVENIEEEKAEKMEKMDDDVLKDSSAAKSTEEISLLKKISTELEASTLGLSTDKNIEESPTEVHWEEGQTLDGDIHLEHLEDENKIKCLASSSASKDIIDVARETDKACDVNLETSEKAFESIQESEVTDMRAEETHSKKTSEANIISENEVSKEEIKEEKEVAETYRPNSLGEEKLTEGLQEDDLMPGECTGQKTNLTFDTTVGGSLAEEPSMVIEKATASKTIIEQVVAEDRSLEHPDRVSVEDKKIKESFPNKFEEINVGESAIKVDSINQDSLENDRTVIAEESSVAILQKESLEGFEKGSKETQKSEETSFLTSEKQITREVSIIDCPDTMASTDNKQHVPPVLSEGILETSRNVEAEDFTEVVHSEAREDKHGEEISEESTLVDSNKASLQKPFEKSTGERTQVDEDVKKERDPTGGKEEMQSEEAESREEEGDEHKKTDSRSDAPVMVEASKDMKVKVVTHKKSLLSGVGSKVKHSISKVKKAITGKSTHHHHSKPMSPK